MRIMQEKQIIKQLKSLSQIQPDSDWVALCKQDILNTSHKTGHHRAEEVKDWVYLHKPSFLVGGLVMASLMLIGFFGFWNSPTNIGNYQELVDLTDSLKQLEANLISVSGHLGGAVYSPTEDPENALLVKEAINETIEQGEEVLARAKKKADNFGPEEVPADVLATLSNLEKTLSEIKQANRESEKQAVERELTALSGMILNERQQDLLEWAKESFQEGDYSQALMAIIELSQN